MHCLLILLICVPVLVKSRSQNYEYSSYDFLGQDYSTFDDYGQYFRPMIPTTRAPPKTTTYRQTKIPVTLSRFSSHPTTASRPIPRPTIPSNTGPPINVISRLGENMDDMQQRQASELYCLEVLSNLVASQWQEDIDRISVSDLKNISTEITIEDFKVVYSNPESQWIQDEGMSFNKLDSCTRKLVSKIAPRMDQDEIWCLNNMYPDYLKKEYSTAELMKRHIRETSEEQLPFRSFYSYFELTELLFENKNIDSLDDELKAIHGDMTDFYIKSEEDKVKKIFILEQECDWKDVRALREASNENARYKLFAQLVKTQANKYLVAEMIRTWVPGTIVPEYRFNAWNKLRRQMEKEVLIETEKLRREKRDSQYLCNYAAKLADKFFTEEKKILFQRMGNITVSSGLATKKKYAYVVSLQKALNETNDDRLPLVNVLAKEYKDVHYCLTNLVRMVENHQRYALATAFVKERFPYGKTYCLTKEESAELMNPRYCVCQGTFCEGFGLATLRAVRFQLNKLQNGTWTVTTNSSYRVLDYDPLIQAANKRIEGQKLNTYWYRHQKVPIKLD